MRSARRPGSRPALRRWEGEEGGAWRRGRRPPGDFKLASWCPDLGEDFAQGRRSLSLLPIRKIKSTAIQICQKSSRCSVRSFLSKGSYLWRTWPLWCCANPNFYPSNHLPWRSWKKCSRRRRKQFDNRNWQKRHSSK